MAHRRFPSLVQRLLRHQRCWAVPLYLYLPSLPRIGLYLYSPRGLPRAISFFALRPGSFFPPKLKVDLYETRSAPSRTATCQSSSSPPWPVASPGRTCSHGRSSEAKPSPLATQSCSPLGSPLALADVWPVDRWPATRWLGGTSRLYRSSRQGSRSTAPRSSRAATAASSYVPQRVMSAAADGRGLEHTQHAAATRPVELSRRRLAASQVTATAR
eukprot:scaffold12430_cov70-Phaeocystis_antarctica.AAC.4